MNNYIEINGCRHYFINENCKNKLFLIDTLSLIEKDFYTNHPFGIVYKPKNCLDTPIRFVKQPNNSVLMFKKNEWNSIDNIYLKKENKLSRFIKKIKKINKYEYFCSSSRPSGR